MFLVSVHATASNEYMCLSAQGKVLVDRTSSCAVVENVFQSPYIVMMQSTVVMAQMKLTAEVSVCKSPECAFIIYWLLWAYSVYQQVIYSMHGMFCTCQQDHSGPCVRTCIYHLFIWPHNALAATPVSAACVTLHYSSIYGYSYCSGLVIAAIPVNCLHPSMPHSGTE